MNLILKTYLFATALLLFGCTLPYKPGGINGGYSHKRTATDKFLVTYQAPVAGVLEQNMRDFCLLRSAEVATEHQFSYFTIESDIFETESSPRNVSTTSITLDKPEGEDGETKPKRVTTTSSSTPSVNRTAYTYEIRCYETPPTQGNFSKVYDAQEIIWEIRSKYGIVEDSDANLGS